MQEMRKKNPDEIGFPRAELWDDYDLNDCAKAVHNEVSF